MPVSICLTPGCWTRINRGYVKRETLCLACRLDMDMEEEVSISTSRRPQQPQILIGGVSSKCNHREHYDCRCQGCRCSCHPSHRQDAA
jgi:hypothetical protein